MWFPSIFHGACLLTATAVFAEPVVKPSRHARFLAVGDSPPFRQEIRGDIRYEIDPPPDSVPPREVTAGFGEELTAAIQVRLGRITQPVKVPEGEGDLVLRRVGDAAEAAPWVSIKRPATGDFLVYLFRSAEKQSWKDAVSLVIPDGPAGSPAGTVRIVNLFPLSINIVWGSEAIVLPAGKSVLKSVKPGSETQLQILVADRAGALKRYYSGAVTQNPGERGIVTIYRADGAAPRRPVKVSMLREPVVAMTPPKKDKPEKVE